MKRYLIFMVPKGNPQGGMGDYLDETDEVLEVPEILKREIYDNNLIIELWRAHCWDAQEDEIMDIDLEDL